MIQPNRKRLIANILDGQRLAASKYGADDPDFDTHYWIDCAAAEDVRVMVEQYDKTDATEVHAEPVNEFTEHFETVEAALDWLATKGVAWSDLRRILPPS